MSEFRMPSLGTDMESGTLVEWLKKPGEPVHRGDVIAVVETQKGAIEVEIFANGIMGQPLVPLGAKVPVGTPLVVIEEPGTAKTAKAASALAAGTPAAPAPEAIAAPAPAVPPAEEKGPEKLPGARPQEVAPRASPAARKAARDRGISLAQIRGTGPRGAVTIGDIERTAQKPQEPRRPGLDLDKMRAAIAAAMAHSKREIPHYYLTTEIDMAHAQKWLEGVNDSRVPERRIIPAVLMLKAVALSLRKHTAFNGFYLTDTGFQPSQHIHVGVAIAIRGGGLASPALHDCDRQDLDSLMTDFRDLVARARLGRLRSSELSDATVTVSNLGDRGVESVFGIIYPPQVSVVGFGKIVQKPVAVNDAVQIRPVTVATLAGDHRVTDGHAGSLFLNEIAGLLNQPEHLL
jgi:pyruvate dehydrogenase E2 component (dihydrolipoamide acetyltransferase)